MTTYLTTQEINELKQLCADPMIELGMTLRPRHLKCFEPHIITKSVTVIVNFPNHESSEAWNKLHEKQIRYGGHGATFLLALVTALIGGSIPWTVAVGSSTAIIKDEVQARIWYPKMFKGWSLTRTCLFQYTQFPSQIFTMHPIDTIRDDQERRQERRDYGISRINVGEPNGIPEEIVKKIMTQFPDTKSVDFKTSDIAGSRN